MPAAGINPKIGRFCCLASKTGRILMLDEHMLPDDAGSEEANNGTGTKGRAGGSSHKTLQELHGGKAGRSAAVRRD